MYTLEAIQNLIFYPFVENYSKKFFKAFRSRNLQEQKKEIKKRSYEIYEKLNLSELVSFWREIKQQKLYSTLNIDIYTIENLESYTIDFLPSQEDIFNENLNSFDSNLFTKHLLGLAQTIIEVIEKENLNIEG